MRRYLLPIFALSLILVSGCNRGGQKGKGGGGVDGGGGGDFIYNTREEVLATVEQTWRLMATQTAANPILHAYNRIANPQHMSTEDELIYLTLEKMLSGPDEIPGSPSSSEDFQFKNMAYLSTKKLNIVENGLCSGPGDHKFLASVTKLDRSGEICVSLQGLMKLPTGNLRRDLVALFAHEIAHLNGADEPTARAVQRYFIKTMAKLLRESSDEVKEKLMGDFRSDVVLQWLGLLPKNYDRFDSANAATANRIAHGLANLQVPDPYVGPDLNIVQPELYLQIKKKKNRLSSYFSALFEGTLSNRTDSLNEKDLRKLRRLGLELVDLTNDFNLYLFGKPLASWYREKVTAATDPRTLTDPSARPTLNGTDCPECRGVGPALRVGVSPEERDETIRRARERFLKRLQPYIEELDRE